MALFGRKKKPVQSKRIKLRGFPGDAGTLKCLLMASERGVPLDVELLDILEGACDRQDYRAISPCGKVPCLGDGEFVTTGAASILAYMDIKGQGAARNSLNPKKASILGEQNYWVQVAERVFEPALTRLLQQTVCAPAQSGGVTPDQAQLDAARERLALALEVLNRQLDGREFIVGEYSFADIHWTVCAHLTTVVGARDLIDQQPRVAAWFERVTTRKSPADKTTSTYDVLPSLAEIKHKQFKSVA
jgi:glutathione S-transferase